MEEAAAQPSAEATIVTGGEETGPVTDSDENIKEGDWVIFCINDEKYSFASIKNDASITIAKRRYPLKTLIGTPYGARWQASRGSKSFTPLKEDLDSFLIKTPTDSTTKVDNRNLQDDSANQKLKQDEILEMQRKGIEGQDIIKALIDNSSSFQSKTEFSQAKYIKKKQQKHLQIVRALRPTSYSLATAYFNKSSSSINFLRPDTLANMLSNANVQAHTTVLVVEACKGLICGAVAERLGGYGYVVNLYETEQPVDSAVKIFNFSKKILDTIIDVPITQLPAIRAAVSSDDPSSSPLADQPYLQLFMDGFDSILIATKDDPQPLLFALFPYLKPSQTVVIFSPYLQQLSECWNALKVADESTNLQLAETWLREFQVLPSRTRPTMQMHGASGYLLSAVKVLRDTQTAAEESSQGKLEAASPAKKKQRTADD